MLDQIKIPPDISVENLKAKWVWGDKFQTSIDQKWPYNLLIIIKITIDGYYKIFHNQVKFKPCLSPNSVLNKVLEGKFQTKGVNYIHRSTGNKQLHTD